MNPAFAFLAIWPAHQTGQTLTLDDALAIADRSSFAIALSESALEKQRQLASQKAAILGPTLSAGGTYLRNDQASSASFGGNSFITQSIDSKSATLNLNWVLDIAGNSRRLLKAAKAQVFAQTESLRAQRNDTRQAVRTAYLGVLRAKSQLSVAQESVASDHERVRTTQLQFDQGLVAKVDLLRAQTQEALSQNEALVATNQLTLAKQSLNFLLARPIETQLDVVDLPEIPGLNGEAPTLVSKAFDQRPDLKALQQTHLALSTIRRATEAGQNPTLNLGVTYTRNIDPQNLGERTNTVQGVLSLNFPIYDGHGTRDLVKAARQDEAQVGIQEDQLKLNIALQIQQAITNYLNAVSRLKVAHDNVATSREALRLAELKRREGLSTLQEVLDARTALTQAETTEVNAKYDALQAVADFQRAFGSDQLPR